MTKHSFDAYIEANTLVIEEIRRSAWGLHDSVGQTYDKTLPYGHHLSMVADAAICYGHEVAASEEDILPIVFAAFYHDSIEDARLSYNDVVSTARRFMNKPQSIIAAEIVYALTNDKGRTRSERAGEHYYAGIRQTPYAPFVKLCDRLANMTYSFRRITDATGPQLNVANHRMSLIYQSEWPHFLQSITVTPLPDVRYAIPASIVQAVERLLAD